jgi:hypothetical protein
MYNVAKPRVIMLRKTLYPQLRMHEESDQQYRWGNELRKITISGNSEISLTVAVFATPFKNLKSGIYKTGKKATQELFGHKKTRQRM